MHRNNVFGIGIVLLSVLLAQFALFFAQFASCLFIGLIYPENKVRFTLSAHHFIEPVRDRLGQAVVFFLGTYGEQRFDMF